MIPVDTPVGTPLRDKRSGRAAITTATPTQYCYGEFAVSVLCPDDGATAYVPIDSLEA
jgi:hypothetical protein